MSKQKGRSNYFSQRLSDLLANPRPQEFRCPTFLISSFPMPNTSREANLSSLNFISCINNQFAAFGAFLKFVAIITKQCFYVPIPPQPSLLHFVRNWSDTELLVFGVTASKFQTERENFGSCRDSIPSSI